VALASAAPANGATDRPAAPTTSSPPAAEDAVVAAVPGVDAEPAAPAAAAEPAPAGPEASLRALRAAPSTWVPGPAGIRVHPRGLHNPGNLCFMNSVLQALMGGGTFCNLLVTLRSAGPSLDRARLPSLAALAELAEHFRVAEPAAVPVAPPAPDAKPAPKDYASVLGGRAASVAPLMMDLVRRFSPRRQRAAALEQEDAQEFLTFVMESLHQELLLLAGGAGGAPAAAAPAAPAAAAEAAAAADGWLTKSGKRAVRQQEASTAPQEAETLVTALFQGKLATSVSCAGAPTSVTVHPFNVVGLAIGSDHVRSVGDALDELTAAETLHDYKPSDGAEPTLATKTERFQRLPHLLVLHLMRFEYNGRSSKVNKAVGFDPRLAMRASWMASGAKERGDYQLVATVSHHGKNMTSGHYTADVLQPDGRWLRFDDGDVCCVSEQMVLSGRTYMLFYQRTAGGQPEPAAGNGAATQ
jgi:ubiquitin carboxyl-terminal hydrolase 10